MADKSMDGIHPLFMSGDTAPNEEQLEALQVLLHDDPPEEIADRCRHNGNEQLKAGRCFYTRAIQYYTQGIDAACKDAKLNSVLYANRAHVNLLKGNLRSATLDCDKAIECNPANVKAYYRAAKASSQLSKWSQTEKYAKAGLEHEPDNGDLRKLMLLAMAKLAEIERLSHVKQQAAAKEESERARVTEAMTSRGLMVCGMEKLGHAIEEMRRAKPYVDEEGSLHWPVLIMYPEHGQTDFILDANENDEVGAHLESVLEETPPWDTTGQYKLDRLAVYFASYAMQPTIGVDQWKKIKGSRSKSSWERVDVEGTIAELVTHPDHVIVGCPVLHVMVAGSPYHEKFLQSPPSMV